MSNIGLDLKACAVQLAYSLGDAAPSYVTLRRWADLGKLKSAERPLERGSKRKLYSVKLLERIVLSKRVVPKPKASTEGAAARQSDIKNISPPDYHEVLSRLDLLVDSIAMFATNQERIERSLKECVSAVQNLEGVRRSLMLKYDSQSAQQLNTIDELKARLKVAERGSDSDHALSLIQSQLSRLTDKVSTFMTNN